MICLKCGLKSALMLGAGVLCSLAAFSQQVPPQLAPNPQVPVPFVTPPFFPSQQATPQTVPPQSFGPVAGEGAAQGSTIRDAGQIYENVFQNTTFFSVTAPAKVGPGEITPGVSSSIVGYPRIPLLRWSVRPEDAQIKLGRLYLQLRAVTASVLFSDNANETQTGAVQGAIAEVVFDLAAIYQVNDNLQLSAAGQVVYLPFKNKIGIADPLGFFGIGYGLGPIFATQITYTWRWGEWDFLASDQLSYHYKSTFYNNAYDVLQGNQTVIEDRIGRYSYVFDDHIGQSFNGENRIPSTYWENRLGVEASRLIPTETRAIVGAYRTDYYFLGNKGSGSTHTWEDEGRFALKNEHENMRFKPFAQYRAYSFDDKVWNHEVLVGFSGPITDNLDFLGDVGQTWYGTSGQTLTIGDVIINDNPRPGTRQSLIFGRGLTEPDNLVVNYAGYHLEQTLGPYLTSEFLAEYRFNGTSGIVKSGFEDYRAGLLFKLVLGPRLSLSAGEIFDRHYETAPGGIDYDLSTTRLTLVHNVSATVDTTIIFQHEYRDATPVRLNTDSYNENLIILSVQKRF